MQAASSWLMQRSWQFSGFCREAEFRFKAISLAFWSLAVKTIYHLARAIFQRCRNPLQDQYLWVNTYHYVANDLQEAIGWAITIFQPERGLQLVEKSRSSEIVRGVKMPYAEEARAISLKDFAAQNQAEMIEKFELTLELTESILDIKDENLREHLNLFDVKTQSDKFLCALLGLQEMHEIDLETLTPDALDLLFYQMYTRENKGVAVRCFQALSLRQKLVLEKNFPTDFMMEKGGLPIDLLEFVPLGELTHFKLSHLWSHPLEVFFPDNKLGRERFQALSSVQVHSIFSDMPKYLRPLVTNPQFEGFDFFNEREESCSIGKNAIQDIFPNNPEAKARFGQISIDLIQHLLGYLPDYLVFSLPQEKKDRLEFSCLSGQQIYDLFFRNQIAGRECFQDLSVEKQLSIEKLYLEYIKTNSLNFYYEGLSWEWLACVDPKKLKQFKLSQLRRSDWESLFPRGKEGRELFFEAFSQEERNSIPRELLPGYLQD